MTDHTNSSIDARPGVLIRYRTHVVVGAHAGLFALALFLAFCLAYNFHHTGQWVWDLYLPLIALALPIKVAVFRGARQFRGSWRYVGLRDMFGVISASLISSFLFLAVYFVLENAWQRIFGDPLIDRALFGAVADAAVQPIRLRQSSVFALDWASTIVLVCAAKILVRFYFEDIQKQRSSSPRRVFIIGVNDTGEAALREILRMRPEPYLCVGFLDDNVAQLHGRIHGVEVVGRTKYIRELCVKFDVQEVLIALPKATTAEIRRLVEELEGTGIVFRTIPAVADVIEGRVEVSKIRKVDIADLLGREPVQLDAEKIGEQLRGRVVLVTGAGGSIGSEMCRQIAAFEPQALILVEQAENNLFEIDRELRQRFPSLTVTPYVADIVDRKRLASILETSKPSVVFHAAAHKHVPMMEINPGEAIKNNVGGTICVAECAAAAGVAKMVMISTDKAVNPTSVMGCSKRVAELFVQSLIDQTDTQFITVRFGNVLGSSGSVVPIFERQIAAGGPVTVTDPDMVRFFMTITEAAQLVLQAGTMGRGGEIYVLHMGKPVKIVDLARDMITLSGLRPEVDIEIVFSGRRPGEKLFEELSHEGEHIGDTAHPKIGIWRHREQDWSVMRESIDKLTQMADGGTNGALQDQLHCLVPEYTPDRRPSSPTRPAPAGTT